MNDALWQSKKEKLTLEAEALERQIEGVRKKLDAVREKLAFMAEMESEASPSLFPDTTAPRKSLPPKRKGDYPLKNSSESQTSLTTELTASKVIAGKPPSLSKALSDASLKLGRFTKVQVEHAMREDNPSLKFNNKSLDRLLKNMIAEGSLVPIGKMGLAIVYQLKILEA